MPIASVRHEEEGREGKPVFIVQTPNPYFHGERCHVTFVNGQGRTQHEDRARRLSEEFGYLVILPSGYRRWPEHTDADVGRHYREIKSEDSPTVPVEAPA